ncbi:hypothetical protein VJ923_12095, partial [Adlercreutzia sp. R25]|uniref:hypothetical protein n=1 Tax=Adlercreutzia shanghongiae TaxID=3111773 RepID=UPI002DC04C9E
MIDLERRIDKFYAVMPLLALCATIGLLLLQADTAISSMKDTARYVISLSAVVYCVIFAVLFSVSKSLSFLFLFALISYPFFFGQQLLMALDVQPSRIYIDLASLSASGVWRASLVVLLCMLVLTV